MTSDSTPTRKERPKARRPLVMSLFQTMVRWFFRILLTLLYRIRVHGLENFPDHDGLLVCTNHQSFLDPLIMGVICPRPVNYLGRKTLFKFPLIAWFLRWNDTIPIDREATGIGGMKETLRRIKRGESVVMFPEGTRSVDGELQPMMSGFCAVAKRTKATLMPIGFEGAFQAYPKNMKIPRPGRIHAVMGKPIPFTEYGELDDQSITDLLEDRVRDCFNEARLRRRRSKWVG